MVVIGRQPIHCCLVNLLSAVSHFSDFPLSSVARIRTRVVGGPSRRTSRKCKCPSMRTGSVANLPENRFTRQNFAGGHSAHRGYCRRAAPSWATVAQGCRSGRHPFGRRLGPATPSRRTYAGRKLQGLDGLAGGACPILPPPPTDCWPSLAELPPGGLPGSCGLVPDPQLGHGWVGSANAGAIWVAGGAASIANAAAATIDRLGGDHILTSFSIRRLICCLAERLPRPAGM